MKKEKISCCEGYKIGTDYYHTDKCNLAQFYIWLGKFISLFDMNPVKTDEERKLRMACCKELYRQGFKPKKPKLPIPTKEIVNISKDKTRLVFANGDEFKLVPIKPKVKK